MEITAVVVKECLLPSPWHLDCKTDNISTWKLLLLPWKDEESPATFALLHEQQTRLQTYCAAAMMPNAKEGYKQISLEFCRQFHPLPHRKTDDRNKKCSRLCPPYFLLLTLYWTAKCSIYPNDKTQKRHYHSVLHILQKKQEKQSNSEIIQ